MHNYNDLDIQCIAIREPDGSRPLYLWNPKTTSEQFWADYWDHEVAPLCRAWLEGNSHREESVRVWSVDMDSPVDFALSRKGHEAGDLSEFLLTVFSIATPHLSMSIIDIPAKGLIELGELLVRYGNQVEEDRANKDLYC